jgi:hypothetical protein
MAARTPTTASNSAGSTQTPTGRIIPGAPVHDGRRGHLMPAGHDDRDAPQHLTTRQR